MVEGGSVMLLIKGTTNFVQIQPQNSKECTNSLWIEVNNDGKNFTFGKVYRSPDSSGDNNITSGPRWSWIAHLSF